MDSNQQQPPKSNIPSLAQPSKRTSLGASGIPSRLPTSGLKKPATPASTSAISGQTSPNPTASTLSAEPSKLTVKTPSNENLLKKPVQPATSIQLTPAVSTNDAELNAASNESLASSSAPPKRGIPAPQTAIPKTNAGRQSSSSTTLQTAPNAAAADSDQVSALNSEITDLKEKLETLKLKRAEDREKLREIEKLKMQNNQYQEFKTKAQENISELNKQLQHAQQETKSVREQYESYKEEMSNYESRLEELTVDKELAEARLEELNEEMDQLKEKYEECKLELEVLKGEIEVGGIDGAAQTFKAKQAEKEQEQLKTALIKMRDLSLQDKSELSSLRKQNDDLNIKLTKLSKECESVKNENSEYLAQINELKDQVTATLGSVEIIEQLTDQNLDLEAKLAELRETIADLEAINEVNDQIQENAREEEKELRETIDLCESRIREYERQIEALKYQIADHDKTLLKFRELVKTLQHENDTLSRQLRAKIDEEKQNSLNNSLSQASHASGTTFDFKQKFIETQNLSKHIENEMNKIELQSTRKYAQYLASFMPDTFTKPSGHNETLLTLVFFKRVALKCELLSNHFREKISNLLSSDAKMTSSSSQLAFFYELYCHSSSIKLLCNKFDYILNTCDMKLFAQISSMYYDFSMSEKNLDSLIELMQKDQLDESINLDSMEKMFAHFHAIYTNYLSKEKLDQFSLLNDLVNFAFMCCELIQIDSQRLQSLIDQKEQDSSEIVMLFRELNFKIDECKSGLKKLQRSLPKEEKISNKIELNFPQKYIADIETTLLNFQLISRSLKEIYGAAFSFKLTNDSTETYSAKKLESLAYQACDKVFGKSEGADQTPYENFRSSCRQIFECLTSVAVCLENGEYEKELSDEEFKIKKYLINSPVQKAADEFKMILLDAENIRQKLDKKDDEIIELKKTMKSKSDELSEQKLRISIVEKKTETQLKEYEEKQQKLVQQIDELKQEYTKKDKEHSDTIEALQQEVDSLVNERRDLKEKLRITNKNKLFENLLPRQASESNLQDLKKQSLSNNTNVALSESSSALAQELKSVKGLNEILSKNLESLRQSYADKILKELPPLPTITSHNLETRNREYASLSHQADELMKRVYMNMASVEAVNLKESNEKKSNKISHKAELKDAFFSFDKIQNKLLELENQLNRVNVNNSIQNNNNTKLSKKELVAEICINPSKHLPNNSSNNKVIELDMGFSEIRDILRSL